MTAKTHLNRQPSFLAPAASGLLQRKCACGQHTVAGSECEPCRKKREGGRASGPEVPSIVQGVMRTSGQPLADATRAYMEPRFGQDLSHVRVHTDAAAAQSARAVDAQAYTLGSHVVFDSGRYAPSTNSGRWLLAHELAHTVQQRMGSGGSEKAAEREADRAADAVQSGGSARVATPYGNAPQRQPADKDVERDKIVGVNQQTRRDTGIRGAEIVWRMLSRYYPEYVHKVSKTSYDEAEPTIRADVKEIPVQGKKVQSAEITYGKAFVETTSEDTLRERIKQLGLALRDLKPDTDPKAPRPDIVFKIIHEKFPTKGRRVAGTSYDVNLPGGLLTEFKSGSATAGKATTSWSGPVIYYGNAFAALPEADQTAKVEQELKKIDIWSVETGHLFKADLDDQDITLRIRGLSSDKLTELRDKVADPDVKQYVGSLLKISTPLEQGLTAQTDGSAKVEVGNITVLVVPDVADVPNLKRPHTDIDVSLGPVTGSSADKKKVAKLVIPPHPTITIHTQYPKAIPPDRTSGYGRGTTESDKAAGAKTVRVHEGSHGLEFLKLIIAANAKFPYPPTFSAKVGDDWPSTKTMIDTFATARQAFFDELSKNKQSSIQAVDCVGISIDDYDHAIKKTQICP